MEKMKNEGKPLVSIIVITYNSAKFVLETLDSAKSQTYQNIELIITDDGSKDETVALCEKWLSENKERFVRTQLITVEKNTGIPANCNRGVKAAQGEWIKLIAGDDAFFDDGIEKTIEYLQGKTIQVLQTTAFLYKEDFNESCNMHASKPFGDLTFFDYSAAVQNRILQYENIICAPSTFLHKSLFKDLMYDETFPEIEDYPFWVMLTRAGYRFYYKDIPTVKYRIHSQSIQHFGGSLNKHNFKLNRSIERINKYFRPGFFYYPIMMAKITLALNAFYKNKTPDKLYFLLLSALTKIDSKIRRMYVAKIKLFAKKQ